MSDDKPLRVYALFLRFSARRSHYSSTTRDRIIFEVFCKAIALLFHNRRSLCFEIFCKAIPTVSYANALTLPKQAIALYNDPHQRLPSATLMC
ncbi:hypothetical protein [Nostoc sp.]|uniref:hypothetical protein n=1 Tax=Nostoc sp. TaxID=1180 RepID=UPI002FF496F9